MAFLCKYFNAESRLCNFWIYALPIQVAHGTVCVQLCTSREVVLVWHNLYSTWYKQIRSRSVVAKFVLILVHAKRWQQCGGTICARLGTCREVAQFVLDGQFSAVLDACAISAPAINQCHHWRHHCNPLLRQYKYNSHHFCNRLKEKVR